MKDLGLRGHRFAPLTWEQMSPAQRQMTEQVLAGQRGSMQGPYNVLLRSPELGDLAQRFGAHTRFHSSLPLALNELAILMVARFWRCRFVWWAHRRIALEAGLPESVILSVATRTALPTGGLSGNEQDKDIRSLHAFCQQLLDQGRVDDATHAAMKARFGEQGIVDAMGAMSYYTLVSMCLNVDQYPLPDGASVEFDEPGPPAP